MTQTVRFSKTSPPREMRPIFIGGCSRSGTTLLAAMLGTGPQLVTVPEAEFKWHILEDATAFDGTVDAAVTAKRLAADPKFALWGVSVPSGPVDGVARRVPYALVLTDLVRRYTQNAGKPQAHCWIDHTPANIRYVRTLAALFPTARFVHIIRDGRAVAASVRPLDFGPNNVVEAADYWTAQVAMGLAAEKSLPADQIITVRFEDLVNDPATTLKTLCEALDITFRPEMISQRDYHVQAYTAHQHELVRRAPDPSRANAWRDILTPREIEIFEARTGDLLGYLGYDLDYGVAARDLRKIEHLNQAAVSLWRRLVTDRSRRALRRRRAARSQVQTGRMVEERASA